MITTHDFERMVETHQHRIYGFALNLSGNPADAASETITLTHQARDRAAFARGALIAARWLQGRQGWFSMTDVLGL